MKILKARLVLIPTITLLFMSNHSWGENLDGALAVSDESTGKTGYRGDSLVRDSDLEKEALSNTGTSMGAAYRRVLGKNAALIDADYGTALQYVASNMYVDINDAERILQFIAATHRRLQQEELTLRSSKYCGYQESIRSGTPNFAVKREELFASMDTILDHVEYAYGSALSDASRDLSADEYDRLVEWVTDNSSSKSRTNRKLSDSWRSRGDAIEVWLDTFCSKARELGETSR